MRRGVGSVLRRELARMRRRPGFHALLLLLMPLATWLVLGANFGKRVARDLPIAVIDQDHTALSRRVTRALDASAGLSVRRDWHDPADAAGILRRGDAYAVVILPRELERRVLRNDPLPVALLYSAQSPLPASIISRDVRTAVLAVSAELDVRARIARGEAPVRAGVNAEPIRTEVHPLFNPGLDYAAFLYLALVPTVFHVFVLMLALDAVGRELKEGSAAKWRRAAGGSVARALIGKLLPTAVWFTCLGTALVLLSLRRLGLHVQGSTPLLLLAVMLLVLAYQAVAVVLLAFTANLRVALTAGAFLAGPAFVVGGITFPVVAMPWVGRLWSYALPLTHYLALQARQITAGAPVAAARGPLGALAGFIIVGLLLGALRYPRLLTDPSLWRRA